jgi:hypothetical protein
VQLRSCPDNTCSGVQFVGPDGTNLSYYQNSTANATSVSVQNLPNGQYFQYKLLFETDVTNYSPKILNVSLSGTGVLSGHESTADQCFGPTSLLNQDYTSFISKDPKYGMTGNTYYAVRTSATNSLQLYACKPELTTFISHTLE